MPLDKVFHRAALERPLLALNHFAIRLSFGAIVKGTRGAGPIHPVLREPLRLHQCIAIAASATEPMGEAIARAPTHILTTPWLPPRHLKCPKLEACFKRRQDRTIDARCNQWIRGMGEREKLFHITAQRDSLCDVPADAATKHGGEHHATEILSRVTILVKEPHTARTGQPRPIY